VTASAAEPPPAALRGDFLAQLVHVGDAAHRLIALQDRDPRSPTHGCFHYAHWRDKTSEFADARYQEAGAALGLLGHPLLRDLGRARGWPDAAELAAACHAGLACLQRLQYPSGCYDEWYKGERGFAATAFTTFAYAAAAIHLGPALAPETHALLLVTLAPAAAWLAQHDDLVKVNHEVVAGAALAAFFAVTGEERWDRAARAKLDRSLAAQTPEGWFPELRGMDFGYSALVLDYLMLSARLLAEPRATAAAARLLDFLLPHLHPDLSLSAEGGTCRNAYAGQAGYALLAAQHAGARAVTARLLGLADSRPRILAYLADDLRLARWSILPVIGALTILEAGQAIAPATALPYPQGWTLHWDAGVAAFHRDDCHVYVPFAGGAVTRVYVGDALAVADLGIDAVTPSGALTSLTYSADRAAELSGATLAIGFELGRARYFFPGFAQRLLLRAGSLTEASSRMTRAAVDRYRLRTRTAINQSAASVAAGDGGLRLIRSVAVEAGRVVVTDRIEGAGGAAVEPRLRPAAGGPTTRLAPAADGSLTIRKAVDLATGRLTEPAA
jgi:hypothetical protein